MNKEQKQTLRIAVAKDVLKSLPMLNVEQGTYLEGDVPDALLAKDSKTVAAALKKNCTVCALGACFVSLVAIDNKFKFSFADRKCTDYGGNVDDNGNDMFARLRKLFSPVQLALIESAFECRSMGDDCALDYDAVNWLELAIMFGKEVEDDTNRLRAIMNNIVANKGLFIPMPNMKSLQ